MADGGFSKGKASNVPDSGLGPDEYDVDISDLEEYSSETTPETTAEGSEKESYIREIRHREEEVLKGELQRPYGVDEILESTALQASGQMPSLPKESAKPRTKVQGEYERQVDEALSRIEADIAKSISEDADLDELIDEFTNDLAMTSLGDVDRLYDHTVDVGAAIVPVVVDTPKEAMQTLRLIEDSLEEETIKLDEIPGLHKILREIADKYPNDFEIKKVALALSNYAFVARTAHTSQSEVPAYVTEAKHKERTEATKRRAVAKQVAHFADKGDFDKAYEIAGKAAETDPQHFRYSQAVMAKLGGKYNEALQLFRELSETRDVSRHLKDLKKIGNYRELIAKTYEGGDLKSAAHAAEHAAKSFPTQFSAIHRQIEEELADYESGAPLLLTKAIKKGKPAVKPDLRRNQIERRRNELAADKQKREEEAKADEARKAELDEQKKKREEKKKALEKEAEELEREAKKLDEIDLPLWETVVKVPLNNIDSVKEALQRLKDALRVRKLTDNEEIELHQFLQEVERRYPTTTELDEDISDINRILKEIQESEDDEPPYRVFPEAPEVPVEYKRLKKKKAKENVEAEEESETPVEIPEVSDEQTEEKVEEKSPEEESQEAEKPAIEPVTASDEKPAEPQAPAEPPAQAPNTEPAKEDAKEDNKSDSKSSGIAGAFSLGRSVPIGAGAVKLSEHKTEEEKKDEEEASGTIVGAFGPRIGTGESEETESEASTTEEADETESSEPKAIETAFSADRPIPLAVPSPEEMQKEEVLSSTQLAADGTEEAKEEAKEKTDLIKVYEALKDDTKFKELLELIGKIKADPEFGKGLGYVDQLRNMPDILPVENGHKYLLEQIIKHVDKKDADSMRKAIGVIVDSLNEISAEAEKKAAPEMNKEIKPVETKGIATAFSADRSIPLATPSLTEIETEEVSADSKAEAPVVETEGVEEAVIEEVSEEAIDSPDVEVVEALEIEAAKAPTPAAEEVASAREKTDETKEETESNELTADALLEAIKEDANYKELARIIKILRTSQRRLDDADKKIHVGALKRIFGTDDQKKIRELINGSDDPALKAIMAKGYQVFDEGEIDGKKILGPVVEGIEGEKTLEAGKRATLELLNKLQSFKLTEESSAVSEESEPVVASVGAPDWLMEEAEKEERQAQTAEEKAPDTASSPALSETVSEPKTPDVSVVETPIVEPVKEEAIKTEKEPESSPKPVEATADSADKTSEEITHKKTPVPKNLMDAIRKAAKGDADKEKKLLDLWEVANEKAKATLNGKINWTMQKQIKEMLDKIMDTVNDSNVRLTAPLHLNRLLKFTENVAIEYPDANDLALENLSKDMLDLLSEEKEFEALKNRMEAIFDILKINPEDYPDNKRKLEDMKEDMKELVLKEIPSDIGMEECKSIEEFFEKFRKLRTRGQIKALEKLNDTIANDKSLEKVIRLFGRLSKNKYRKASPRGGGGTPPASLGASGGTTPSAMPSGTSAAPSAPSFGPSATAPLASAPMGLAPSAVSAASSAPSDKMSNADKEKYGSAERFMNHMGFKFDKSNPASVALINLLNEKARTPDAMKALESFLKSGEYSDEIDQRIKGKTKADIKKEIAQAESELNALNIKIRTAEREYTRGYAAAEKEKEQLKTQHETLAKEYADNYGSMTPQDKRTMSNEERQKMESLVKQMGVIGSQYQKLVQNPFNSKVDTLYAEKSRLENDKVELTEGLKRLTQKKGKETVHYKTPEQLLGMINLYFHKQELGGDETPDFSKVLADTQEKIETARKKSPNKLGWLGNRMNLFSYLKPTLTATLETVVDQDKSLSKITPEQAKELAKVWDDAGGVESWIRELEGSEKDKMENIVPAIVGHLSIAVNAGGASYLNALSVNRGIKLLSILRKAIHEYSIEHAERQSGDSLQKMGAYFGQLNSINKKTTKIKQKIISKNMYSTVAKRALIPAGVAAGGVAAATGALAIASMGGIAIASAAAGGVGATATAASVKLKDPEQRAIAKKIAVRGLVAGGLGALAVGAAPIAGIAALGAGAMSPEIWKNKKKIGAKTVKGGWKYGGFVLGLATLGLAFTNPRFNRFFGLSK